MPVRRGNDLDPVEFARVRLGFEPDKFQAQMIRSTAKRGIVLCARQSGKSTAAAVKAVIQAYQTPKTQVVLASPFAHQSGEFLLKVLGFLEQLGIQPRHGGRKMSILMPNGSRIIGLPGVPNNTRSLTASLLMIDEAAFAKDDLYYTLLPTLGTTNGALWLMSTAGRRSGFLHEAWQHGGDTWERIFAPATECPRIGAEFLERARSSMPERKFRQDFLCEFVDDERTVFDRMLVERAISSAFAPWKLGAWRPRRIGNLV